MGMNVKNNGHIEQKWMDTLGHDWKRATIKRKKLLGGKVVEFWLTKFHNDKKKIKEETKKQQNKLGNDWQ